MNQCRLHMFKHTRCASLFVYFLISIVVLYLPGVCLASESSPPAISSSAQPDHTRPDTSPTVTLVQHGPADMIGHDPGARRQGDTPSEPTHPINTAGLILIVLLVAGVIILGFLIRHLNKRIAALRIARQGIAKPDSRFRDLFLHAPVPLIEIDPEGNVLRFNEAISHALGYTLDDVKTVEDWYRVAYPDPVYREQVRTRWDRMVADARENNGRAEYGEARVCCRDGTSKVFLISASLIKGGMVASLVDIDERKRMELELETSRERFATLFELAPFSCVINDMEGRYLMVNEYLCDFYNRPRDQIIGRTMAELGRDMDPEDAKRIVAEIKRTGSCSLQEVALKQGDKTIYSLFSSRLIDWGSEKAFLSATVNITEKKQAEEQLRRNEESLRVTLDSIGDAVIATDTKGRIVRMNPVAVSLTGWSVADGVGQPLTTVFSIVNALTRKPAEDPVAKVLATGEIVGLANHTVLIARGGKEFQIADSGAPIRNDAGTIIGVVLVFRDVTQEYAMAEQLRQAQKMQALGQLSGGVAHDFNNMLGAILGAAELLADSIEKDPVLQSYLDMIMEASERAASLTGKLLAFSRKQPSEMKAIDIHRPIRDALSMIERTMDRRIRLVVSESQEPIKILGDPSQLQNAMLNLLINATHAMPDGGTLAVATRRLDLDEAACTLSGFALEPGHYVEVEIRDTGCGIPPENLSRIFDPFFTTKEQGKGTGLGLAAVFGTIKQHLGIISVYSEPGQGTSFLILLPTTDTVEAEELLPSPAPQGGGERILVVDDEPAMREIAGKILTHLGYTVTLAENGRQAMALFEAAPEAFDLIILDMIMPEMNGRDCFNALRKYRPDVRVVLASGFTPPEDVVAMQQNGLADFIRKPFRKADLDTLVQSVLKA